MAVSELSASIFISDLSRCLLKSMERLWLQRVCDSGVSVSSLKVRSSCHHVAAQEHCRSASAAAGYAGAAAAGTGRWSGRRDLTDLARR